MFPGSLMINEGEKRGTFRLSTVHALFYRGIGEITPRKTFSIFCCRNPIYLGYL